MADLTRTEALLVRIIHSFRAPVYRTKLVKLAYLIDYAYYRNFGRTITGLKYMWDDHGPNAVGNALVSEASRLVRSGRIFMETVPNQYGDNSYRYGLLDKRLTSVFTPAQEHVITEIIEQYRKVPLPRLIALSKATKPFRTAKQYDVLRMERDTPAEDGDPQQLAEYERGLSENGTKSLEEIKGKYGLS